MLDSSIVITDGTNAAKTFKSIVLPSGPVRIDTSTDLKQPRILEIKHSQTGKDLGTIDRHLVKFQVTKRDASGVASRATVNVTLELPQAGAVSKADLVDLVALAKNFLSSANIDGLLINEA